MRIRFTAPAYSELQLGDAINWSSGWAALWASAGASPSLPLLLGRASLRGAPLLLRVDVLEGTVLPPAYSAERSAGERDDTTMATATGSDELQAFARRREALTAIAGTLQCRTPDPFLDGMFSALGIAADAIWDETQGCVMHGAVAWRMPLAGWRGPYVLDVTGRHERMRR